MVYRINNKSCVTIVGYMLGVSEYVLERDYSVDYIKLEGISFLEELKIIRCLSKVRQNIFKNFKAYKNKCLLDVENTYVDEELLYLKGKGYDLFSVSKLDNSTEYLLNSIKKDVDYLVTVVLDKLNMVYSVELKSLFEFPIFDKKSLLNFVSSLKGRSLPHGVIIPRYKKIQTSLQYLLSNDTTLYAGAFSLCGREFSPTENVIEPFDWSKVGVSTTDVVDVAKVESAITSNIDTNCNDIVKFCNCSKDDNAVVSEEIVVRGDLEPNINLEPNIKRNIIDANVNVVKSCDTYFVDCDNIDFFKFLSMLDTLEEEGVRGKVFYLYTDLKATYLWDILDDIRHSDAFNFIYKRVDRVKGNKSVVDLVITVDICKEVMVNGSKTIGLISSDSDFYGVLSNVDADFIVGYSSDCTSSAYLHYLGKNDYTRFDVKVFEKEETLTKSLDKVVTYLVLSILSNVAMSCWDLDVLVESVRGSIEKESSFTPSDIYIKDKVANIISDLRVVVKDSMLYFSYRDITIKMEK